MTKVKRLLWVRKLKTEKIVPVFDLSAIMSRVNEGSINEMGLLRQFSSFSHFFWLHRQALSSLLGQESFLLVLNWFLST